MKANFLISILLMLLLAGCSHPRSDKRPTAWLRPGTKIELPAPGISHPIRSQQVLTGHFNGQTQSLVVMLNADHHKLSLAGLSPMGIRLFLLTYDQQGIHSEQSIVVPNLPPASQVLADVMLSFYPLPSWQQQLPSGWTLQDEQDFRRLRDTQGQLVTEIHYRQIAGQRLPISIEQHAFHYHLTLDYLTE